jgi:hypothetical protein
MLIRRLTILASSLLFMLLLSGMTFSFPPSGAPAPSPQEDYFTVEGKITEKTANRLTISTGENMVFHVTFDDKTEIKKKDGSPGTGQDLHTGLRVSIAGDLTESGEIKARKIAIEPEGSENKSTGEIPAK